jgi:hypothetical protein
MMRGLARLGVAVTVVAAAVLGPSQPALAAPALDVSVTSARLQPGGLQVVLTGRYVCGPFTPGSDGVVDLDLRQAAGSQTTTGYGYVYLTVCDGSTQAWSSPVDSVGGAFVRGRAEVLGGGYACDRGPSGDCAFGSFGPTTVRIR